MSAWGDNLADLSAACIDQAAFGEPCILTDGTVLVGIFDIPGRAPGSPLGSDVGLAMIIPDQTNPAVTFEAGDADPLTVGDIITIRTVPYAITRKHPADGGGLVAIELMPVTDGAALPMGSRYR